MKLPKHIKDKMQRIMKLRGKERDIEQDVMKWFEDKGFNIGDDSLLPIIDILSYSEATVEEIQELLDELVEYGSITY